jgi:hypothetical protein
MSEDMSTIVIGVNSGERVVTVSPPVLVVEAGSRVQVRLEDGMRGRATIRVLGDGGREIPGDPDLGSSFEATRTGIYYVVVAMSNPGKLGAMVVIIIDP